jgi:hypothetical protein
MQTSEAIAAFSQSEKIKSGIIWVSQTVEMFNGLPDDEKQGAQKIVRAVISMIGHEIHLCKKSAPHELWADVEKNIDLALVMIDSQVAHESVYHLTRALTRVTTIGHQSLSYLKDQGLM